MRVRIGIAIWFKFVIFPIRMEIATNLQRHYDVSMKKSNKIFHIPISHWPEASLQRHGFSNAGCTGDKINDSSGIHRFYDEKEAVDTLYFRHQEFNQAGSYAYSCLLQRCVDAKALMQGQRVHTHMIKTGFYPRTFLQNRIIDMYGKCGRIHDARKVFDRMPERDVFTWTTIIVGYTKCGTMEHARQLFDKMPERNAVSWNAIIAGYAQDGHSEEALKLFEAMQRSGLRADQFVFTSALSACASLVALDCGKQVHAQILRAGFESDVSSGNALITMYSLCGHIVYARQLFEKMDKQDLVTWNAIITGHAQQGQVEEVFKLFVKIKEAGLKPDHCTLSSILNVCASSAALQYGRKTHADVVKTGFERNIVVGSSLVDVYAKCRRIEDAHQVFRRIPKRNVVSWTAMVVGYAQNGHHEEALGLFCQMLQAREKPNQFTLASALSACASLADMEHGKQIHAQIIILGFDTDVSVGNSLITMYSRCGDVEDANQIFSEIPERNMVSWNTMVVGYAQHGHGKKALHLFEQMLQTGMKPNDITFIGILSACNHAGLVDEGWYYMVSMIEVYNITPRADHYACMIDLLGRAGRLEEAKKFIKNMPVEPNADAWRALLGACRIHGNLELAKHAAECLFELEPENGTLYVMLSNIYMAAGRWDDAAKLRKVMKNRGMRKKPGCSWIQIKNKVHAFVAEDRSYPQRGDLCNIGEINGEDERGGLYA